ncbi:hypothetical protein NM688_g2344 [Phlebia brevispora]|uniref:Uncharacterized protein n=1 Tax=Phlebia brevispora TaxID=194682 RepID=A0ACC1T9J6_9APHY|nr:hypothetical protein NM688_g2344 [Phlebia brevispora]
MAKTTVEKHTKVKKTPKATPAKPKGKPPKSPLPSVVSESKPETSKAKPPSVSSKKRKVTAEDAVAEAITSDKPHSKAKKPRTEAGVVESEKKVTVKEGKGKKEKKKSKDAGKAKEESPVAESDKGSDDEQTGADAALNEEEEVEFFGFSTDDEDSSDEELDAEPEGLDVTKLPTIAKDDVVVKQKLEKAKKRQTGDRGVIYLGRIPHGFYEDQMKAYFAQFGNVTRLRLSRSKKTGRSKHYAFIEFDSSEVAQIVAETMDNYLLTGHILTCKVIPKDEVHPELWVGANRKWRVVPNDRISRLQHNKARTEEEQEKAEKRLLRRQEEKKRKLAETGIEYDIETVGYKRKAKPVKS